MDEVESYIKRKLKDYNENDIIFLKEKWQKWIKERKWKLFEKKTGVNIQAVYDILNPLKIKSIRQTKNLMRYEITLKHSEKYDVSVIITFDAPKNGNLGIVTLYKHKN